MRANSFSVKLNKEEIWHYILMFIFITVHGTVVWAFTLKDVPNKPLIILGLLLLCSLVKRKRLIPNIYYYFALILIITNGISASMNDGGFLSGSAVRIALTTITYTILGIYVYAYNPLKAPTRYIKTIVFFASISLFFYVLQNLFGSSIFVEFLFPKTGYNTYYVQEYGNLFYVVNKYDLGRNIGIFYEPGVYQVVLNLALYILLFYSDRLYLSRRKINKYILLLIITIITTMSTTGLLSLFIILSISIIKSQSNIRKKISLIVICLVLLVIFETIINGNESLIYKHVIQKITDIHFKNGTYDRESSGGARIFVIDKAIQAIKRNPLFGVGDTGYGQLTSGTRWAIDGTGNILFITIAKTGVLSAIVSILPVLRLAAKKINDKLIFLVFVLVYFNTVLAQSYIVYPVFMFVACMQYGKRITKRGETV